MAHESGLAAPLCCAIYEALERLVEKVGRIDLHAGDGAGGLQALLSNLYRLSDAVPAKGRQE